MKRILFFAIVVFWSSCEPRQGKSVEDAPPNSSGMNEIVVQEVIQATSYTYVKAQENGLEVWIAIPKSEVKTGNTYYYDGAKAMEMKAFKSKDLDRTFESIYFLGGIYDTPEKSGKTPAMAPDDANHKKKESTKKEELTIQKEEGIVSISKLYENTADYENKRIKVKGLVTKYNPNIMGKNWVHIQDGTGDKSGFDLTITTNDVVGMSEIVTFEGLIILNKDFGAGYKYDLIMEEATLQNKKSDLKVN